MGQVITIALCNLTLDTASLVANGQVQTGNAAVSFNGVVSGAQPLTVSISPSGQVTVPGGGGQSVTIGIVTTTNATGG